MGTIARLMMLAPGDILLCEVLLCSRAAMCLSCITVVSAAMSVTVDVFNSVDVDAVVLGAVYVSVLAVSAVSAGNILLQILQ